MRFLLQAQEMFQLPKLSVDRFNKNYCIICGNIPIEVCMNIYGFVEENFRLRTNKAAIKTKDREITYAELTTLTRSLGSNLRKAGIGFGDHITLMLPNIPEFIISYMATIGIGATIVPVNPTYTSRELLHILMDSDSKALIIEASNIDTYLESKDKYPVKTVITTGENGNFNEWITGNNQPILIETGNDDVASMVYSSGLTGYSMGAQLTHGNLEHNSGLMERVYKGTDKEMSLTIIPCFHSFSATINMLTHLRLGGTVYLMKRPDFKEMGQAINSAGITNICAVPTLFFGLVNHPDVQNVSFSKMRFLIAGGSALSIDIFNSFKEKFGLEIMHGYGITEASPVCSANNMYVLNKPESIGIPVPDVKVSIIDEDGKTLAPGQQGEILFKGPNIMKGYYKRPKETAEIIQDGWLHTGDLGHVDEDGYIYITGYKKDMIITSGFNVYCREVENVLSEITGIRESAITGIPDLMRGAIIKAFVVSDNPALSENDVKQYARKQLAPYKTPRIVVFVDKIPRNEKGKPQFKLMG
jgi:long-chain acyl-CoA synthetase